MGKVEQVLFFCVQTFIFLYLVEPSGPVLNRQDLPMEKRHGKKNLVHSDVHELVFPRIQSIDSPVKNQKTITHTKFGSVGRSVRKGFPSHQRQDHGVHEENAAMTRSWILWKYSESQGMWVRCGCAGHAPEWH